MDEGKELPESQGPAEESQSADNGLVSKLARAYSSLPPELRSASTLPSSGDPLSNPELEVRFQKLLKDLEVPGASQVQGDHKPDLKAIALLEKKIKELQAQGDNLSDGSASAEPVSADKVTPLASKQCGKCGHLNSASIRYCGMCGAELNRSGSADGKVRVAPATSATPAQREPEVPAFLIEHGGESRSRRRFSIGLLGLLLAALILLASHQWPLWRQRLLVTWGARGLNAQPGAAAPAATAPAPSENPANPQIPVKPSEPAPAASTRSQEAQKTSPKPAPPTVIKRPLPGPVPLPSALPEPPGDTPARTQPGQEAAIPEGSQSPAQRTRVSQGVAQAGLIFKVDPEYPPVARTARIQGSVVLHAIIGTDGTVQQLQVVSGNPLLASPALNAVKNWRYRPYLVDGQPVEVETTVTVNFKGE